MALSISDFTELNALMFPGESLSTILTTLLAQAETAYPDSETQQKAYVYVNGYEKAKASAILSPESMTEGPASWKRANASTILDYYDSRIRYWSGILEARRATDTELFEVY